MSTLMKGLLIAIAALAIDASAVRAAVRGGSGGHSAIGWHAGGWKGSAFRPGYRGHSFRPGYYGGYYDAVVADDDSAPGAYVEPDYVGPTQPTGPLVPPVLALSCQRNAETVIVPSEAGGMRQIKITRC